MKFAIKENQCMDWLISMLLFSIVLLLFLYDFNGEKESRIKEYGSISKKEYITVFIGIALTVFGYMYVAGVLECGYHIVDDQDIYVTKRMLSEYGLFGAMRNRIVSDLSIRFRFTYWIVKTFETWLFGNQFVLWHIAQSVISVLSLYSAYIFARKMKTAFWQAYLFVIVVFIGRQSAILWRLGPQESIGMLLLFLTLISLQNYIENKKVLPISIILTFFLGGIKESFLLLLPLLPFLLVFMELKNCELKISLKSAMELVRKRWIYFVASYLIFAVDMAVILCVVGTNKIGYAGIDAAFTLKDYIISFVQISLDDMRPYVVCTVIGSLFCIIPISILVVQRKKEMVKEYFVHLGISIITLGYFLVSQYVLYAKSGIGERYLVPVVAGVAIFWLIDIGNLYRKIDGAKECYCIFVAVLAFECIIAGGYAGNRENGERFRSTGLC